MAKINTFAIFGVRNLLKTQILILQIGPNLKFQLFKNVKNKIFGILGVRNLLKTLKIGQNRQKSMTLN